MRFISVGRYAVSSKLRGHILLLSFALLMCHKARGQETLFPSASSIAVLKASGDDVNLYSGKVDVNIPIYTVRDGSLALNIALKYIGGSGIKVQETAGECGLGWAMTAGAVITRTVNRNLGKPNSGLLTGADSLSLVKGLQTQENYLNLDVFNSSLGGRIIFDANNKALFMKEQGFKIEEDGINSPDRRWVIVSPAGDRYYFGETLASKEMFVLAGSLTSTRVFSELACAWHLSRIVSSRGEETRFEYEKGDINNLVEYKYWEMTRVKKSNNPDWTNSIKQMVSRNGKIRLSRIITDGSIVRFRYSARTDVQNADAISEISVSDGNNVPVTKFVFETGYFKSGDPTPALRLRLNSVRQETPGGESRLVAAFEYDESENLPASNSSQFDYWGYYNNNSSGKYFVSEGADRSADLRRCQANILTAIRWPTGGRTLYTYELNSYLRKGVHYNGGGLRISSIAETDRSGVLKKTAYDYSTLISGKKVTSGLIHSLFDITRGYTSDYTSKSYFMTDHIETIMTENALPVRKIIDLDGITVGYSRVTVTRPDLSSEEYSFQDYASFPDMVKYYRYTSMFFKKVIKDLMSVNSGELYNGLSSVTSNSQQRGLVTKKIIRNSKNEILKSFSHKYSVLTGAQIAGLETIDLGSYNPDDRDVVNIEQYKLGALYSERVMSVRLTETKEESYYPGSSTAQSVTTTNTYKGMPYPYLLTGQTQKQSDGTVLATSYTYPSDMIAAGKDPTNIYVAMVGRNMVAPVIEKTEKVNNVQTSLVRTNYKWFDFGNSSLLLPQSIQQQNGSSPADTVIAFKSYTAKGKPLEMKAASLPSVVSLWGYGDQYRIADIRNATYDQVKNILGDALISSLNTPSVTDASIAVAVSGLKKVLPKAAITSYTYKPLVGMSSMTDERDKTVYYSYDGFGRLTTVKDDSLNVVQAVSYNIPQLPKDARIVSLAYKNKIIGSGEALCASVDSAPFYVISTQKDGPVPITVGTVLYKPDGSFAPAGYYSRGSGIAYIAGGDGKVTTIYQCWDQWGEIEW